MTKMRTGAAISWLVGGVVWFVLLMLLAFLGPGAKITPKQTAKQFFTATQYQILYGRPEFDAQNPNPKFALNPSQVSELKSWDLNDCVATDGTVPATSNSQPGRIHDEAFFELVFACASWSHSAYRRRNQSLQPIPNSSSHSGALPGRGNPATLE